MLLCSKKFSYVVRPKKVVFSFCCLFLFSSCVKQMPECKKNEIELRKAQEIIVNCTAVTSNRIYESAEVSRNSWAFSILYQHCKKYKVDLFTDIFYKSKNNEGKTYALFALFMLDNEKYCRLKTQLIPSIIHVIWYCEDTKINSCELLTKEKLSISFLSELLITPIPKYENTVNPE